jgi:hypothetical protein
LSSSDCINPSFDDELLELALLDIGCLHDELLELSILKLDDKSIGVLDELLLVFDDGDNNDKGLADDGGGEILIPDFFAAEIELPLTTGDAEADIGCET